jgi:hypothetical protein
MVYLKSIFHKKKNIKKTKLKMEDIELFLGEGDILE